MGNSHRSDGAAAGTCGMPDAYPSCDGTEFCRHVEPDPQELCVSRPPVDRRLQYQIIFAFLVIYVILLSVRGGDSTSAQLVFRWSAGAIGVIGFATVSRRRS